MPRPTGCADRVRHARQREIPRSVIIDAVVDETDELVVLADQFALLRKFAALFSLMLLRQIADIPRPGHFGAIAYTRGYKPSALIRINALR
jgi:hypothetical protein